MKDIKKMLSAEHLAENIFYEFSNNKIFSLIRRLFELIKNLIETQNTQKINKSRFTENRKRPKNKQAQANFSNSVSNFAAKSHCKNPLLNTSNEIYKKILDGNFNFNEQTNNNLVTPLRESNPDSNLKRSNNNIFNSEENTFSENSPKKIKNASYCITNLKAKNYTNNNIKNNSDKKFVLNSLQEFHANNNNNNYNTLNNINSPTSLSSNVNNNLTKRLKYQSDSSSKEAKKALHINKVFKNKSEKNIFKEILKDQEAKGELIKLETIHEQKFDNTNYNNINSKVQPFANRQTEPDYFKKINNINNSFKAQSINNSQNLGLPKQDKNVSIKSSNFLDIAAINKTNKNKISKISENRIVKKFKSQTSLFNYLKSYENSYSEKNKNDQMLYLIRKNINEIKLSNPL
jgi:hypothetical protein